MNQLETRNLRESLPLIHWEENVPLASLTTLKVGGPARLVCYPKNEDEVLSVVKAAHRLRLPFHLLGFGSNILAKDKGYDGLLIILTKNMKNLSFDGQMLTCQAGVPIVTCSYEAANQGLSGIEFACGIPGSVGGAVAMNAGAYEKSIDSVFVSCRCINHDCQVVELSKEEMNLGYRTSRVIDEKLILLSVTFQLHAGIKTEIIVLMEEYNLARKQKQPLEYPSAGSFFKRPPGNFAGALIEQAGLKGFSVNGAKVSEKHAGFLINTGNATAKDFFQLSRIIQDKVYQRFGVRLETEVQVL